MAQWLIANASDKYEIITVFANTGKEREETLCFIKRCDLYFGLDVIWIEPVFNPIMGKGTRAKTVNFATANRTGEPFEEMMKKHGMPNQNMSICSKELKNRAIRAYALSIGWGKCFTAIGIRVDEIDRISSERKKRRFIYPLVSDIETSASDINKYWNNMPFDLELKSYEGNCDLCWKKSLRNQLTILHKNPEIAEWWIEMEDKYDMLVPPSRKAANRAKVPVRFFRNRLSARELLEMSKTFSDLSRDTSKDTSLYKQMSLFWFDLDTPNGCSESCEVH